MILLGLFLSLSSMAQQNDSTQVLEGKLTRTQLEQFGWFKKQYNTYKPFPAVLQQLTNYPKCSIMVVLGTWCSDSHELVPQLFKVGDMAGWENIELIGVDDNKPDKYKQALSTAKKYNVESITSIPCFEFWFLLHCCYTTSPFSSYKELRPKLESEMRKEGILQKGETYNKSDRLLYEKLKPNQ